MFCASAKLERKCPRGRLLEKHANHTQIAGDISLGFSVGASRVAPGLFFSGPNSSQERLGPPKHFSVRVLKSVSHSPEPGNGTHHDQMPKTTPTGTPNGPKLHPQGPQTAPFGLQNACRDPQTDIKIVRHCHRTPKMSKPSDH